jgi:hypothetical protein
MATAPQIKLRDDSGFTQNLVFTTNQDSVFIDGQVDVNTADIQVSINGAPFVSNPTLVRFDLPNFKIPNPENFPTGLLLDSGENTILVRTIDIVGGVSGTSSVSITRVRNADLLDVEIPTGIRVRRLRNAVNILAAKPETRFAGAVTGIVPLPSTFRGFNFYASSSPSGATGYFKLNDKVVTETSTTFEETTVPIAVDSTRWENVNQKLVKIRVSEVDEFGDEIALRLETQYDISDITNNVRFFSTLEQHQITEFIQFQHVRGQGLNAEVFTGIADTDPLYYVVTGVYYDPGDNIEVESPYSQEVLGAPLVIDTTIRDLPQRNAFQVLTSFIGAIERVNREISLVPGSTTRDVSIDPFASEAERLYFIVDFVHKCQSFLTLLQLDDPNGDGISDPVESSAYKTALRAALGLESNAAVQALIDAAFDKLAGNFNKRRLPGRPAVGQAVFYTATRPTFNLTVPSGTIISTEADSSLGIPSVRFRVGGTYTLPVANADAYYNFSKKRYELTVDIVAEVVGSDGNRPAGQIKASSGISGFSVVNEEATVFGTDFETNADLAARAMLGFVSVDSGTEGGYTSTAAEQIGVLKAKVIKSGDALMMRDYDPIRRKHIGGKVDIWVQGLRERQVSETFAFTFEIARDITCQIIDLPTLTFRVQDSRVTPNNPIIEIFDNLSQGLGVRNVTQGIDYDLTGVEILDYQTFRINPLLPLQPVTDIDDVIVADYRFRVVNQFKFGFQPVRRVVSVVGEISGPLDALAGYKLYKTDDPLLEGESTIANDYLVINQVGGIPSGDSIIVNAEEHVLIGFIEEPLKSIGINTKTIRVFNVDRTIEYDGPETTVPDFNIIEGTPTTPVRIVRTASSEIPNGATVSVDYTHDENFTVTYVINDLLQELQRTINRKRHITADVVVKQSINNEVEIETTVQLNPGATKDRVDPEIRSAVSLDLDRKLIGQGTAQSDIIRAIDATEGVDFSTVPPAKMGYADGSRKLRETVDSNAIEVFSLSIGGNAAFLLTSALKFPTTDGGGLETEHRGVFQDDEPLTMAANLSSVASEARQAYIIGSAGATIEGYTDVPTLVADGFTDPDDQAAELIRRTANRVVVSMSSGGTPRDTPGKHRYACSYIIRGDKGSKDISAAGVEFLSLGRFTLTFRTAT